jgi:hypothetical protein
VDRELSTIAQRAQSPRDSHSYHQCDHHAKRRTIAIINAGGGGGLCANIHAKALGNQHAGDPFANGHATPLSNAGHANKYAFTNRYAHLSTNAFNAP